MRLSLIGLLAFSLLVSSSAATVSAADKPKVDKAAVERTRKQVRMLDDIYKTAVVLITTHYVEEETDLSAGSAAKALFSAIKEKGWHDARLIDATGNPYNDENVAKDEFEKQAIEKLKNGESYVDEVVVKDGKPYLRAATIVPVVMQKCTLCHPHYEQAKKGAAIGAIGYTLPIE
ncbi:MAG: DUF3365 domain-containing protein [Pirellulaceae bacterium]|nr:DUF3365 domain-containing protein [Planctomycetales bacterium]MCA9161808.1 DUF3365 domain-containing protein [Planctomycetales bacterium]MCA9203970.1 DUF3365 domain-containing protein [Planctomycetales bacterium]MCA9209768.1 DUF3365 domain-containing protein [Planctomycetales bacterium]MCA9221922.1 DUF3365 domain-containing protein [Planctomycetales bacterium]